MTIRLVWENFTQKKTLYNVHKDLWEQCYKTLKLFCSCAIACARVSVQSTYEINSQCEYMYVCMYVQYIYIYIYL